MQRFLKPGERLDAAGPGLYVIQRPDGFCYGTDAVLLAGFSTVKPRERMMDLCTGTGIIPLLLAQNVTDAQFHALELQEEVCSMARRSVAYNGLSEKIFIKQGDLRNIRTLYEAGSFHAVTCNPPYMLANSGKQNAADTVTIARHEIMCTLEDVIAAAAYLLRSGGRYYMVHRPERMADAFFLMKKHRLEPKRLQLVHKAAESAPSLFLVEGQKNRNSGLKVLEPLCMNRERRLS